MKSEVVIKKFPLKAADKSAISIEIEKIKQSCTEFTYMDSILLWAEANDIDPSDMGRCINSTLKEKFENEAINAKLVKSKNASSTRPLDKRLFGL